MNWLAFISFVFVTSFTPGPNNVVSTTLGSKHGYFKTVPFILGVSCGFVILLSICSFFANTIYHFFPGIKGVIGIVGALYLSWLAYKLLKSKTDLSSEQEKSLSFWHGTLMQFLNPKAIIFGLTISSTFIVPYARGWHEIIMIIIFLALVAFMACSTWALGGALFQKLLCRPPIQKAFNIVLALLLVYCAFSISGLDQILKKL